MTNNKYIIDTHTHTHTHTCTRTLAHTASTHTDICGSTRTQAHIYTVIAVSLLL